MRNLTRVLLLPALLLAGLLIVASSEAEARVVRYRCAPRVVVPAAPVYVSPYYSGYWHPGVHIAAPGVRVDVGPGKVYAPSYVPAPAGVVIPAPVAVPVPPIGIWW